MKHLWQSIDAWMFTSAWQRVTFAVSLIVLGFLAYATVAGTLGDDLDTERNNELALKDSYRNKLAQTAGLAAWRQRKAALPPSAAASQPTMPIGEFLSMAKRHGLRMDSVQTDEPDETLYPYVVRTTRIQLRGEYSQFSGLMDELARSGQAMALREQAWKALPASTDLALQAGLDTYRPMNAEESAEWLNARKKVKPEGKP